jgi:uncharacterized SAM-binding protein YcdF (DUF218 family)
MPDLHILEDVPSTQKLNLIICLGCQLNRHNEPTWMLQARVDQAAIIFQHHPESLLLLTGGKSYLQSEVITSEAEAMRKYLLSKYQVDRTRLLLETESTSTIEQLCMIKHELIEPEGYHAMALVSDEFHIRRAAFMFKQIMGPEYNVYPIGAMVNLSGKYLESLRQLEDSYYQLTIDTYGSFTPGDHQAILEADRKNRNAMRQHVAKGGDALKPVKLP